MVTVIIDRVGNTNVFNLVAGNRVENPAVPTGESLQSITDEDLIAEFQEELNRIASISRSLSSLPEKDSERQAILFQHLNLNTQLQQIGEAFFRQFFPETLQKFFIENSSLWLHFHVTPSLASIPFEILHDGKSFLWEKYYLGKSVKGGHATPDFVEPKEHLNMLIVVDPTEDLEWARKEGEMIFEHLSSQFPDKSLHIELLGGKSLNKLNLLNALQGKDIIHYSGHLHYTGSPDENGWKLYGGKILHAREIKKSGADPMLILSNSCISGRSAEADLAEEGTWYTKFAGSFIKSSKTAYIGTNWHVPDNEPTILFTIKLYEYILQGKTLGEALYYARKYARENFALNDLTWASYMLMGNPNARLFEKDTKVPDIYRDILSDEAIEKYFPFPIAEVFSKLRQLERSKADPEDILRVLFQVFDELVFFIGALVRSNAIYLKIDKKFHFPYPDTKKILREIYQILSMFSLLKTRPVIPNLIEVLYRQKDNFEKIENWKLKSRKQKSEI
ncbi:MAG: CHAT domain-containing protein, partial [Candidatus Hydrogenedentota bacterium]